MAHVTTFVRNLRDLNFVPAAWTELFFLPHTHLEAAQFATRTTPKFASNRGTYALDERT